MIRQVPETKIQITGDNFHCSGLKSMSEFRRCQRLFLMWGGGMADLDP